MTTSEMGRDPEKGGALGGAVLIVAIGVALGIAYNAVGLAGRPARGLAWVKSTPKIESLESVLSEPTPTVSPVSQAPSEPNSAGPGTAVAAESPKSSPPTPAGSKVTEPPAGSSKPVEKPAAGAAASSKAAPSKAAPSKAGASKAAPSKAGASKAGTSKAGTKAGAADAAASAASKTATPGANAGSPPATATHSPAPPTPAPAADLPVIPDVPGPLKVQLATLKKLYDANAALVIDAREAAEYGEGHISGALSLPYNDAMAEPEKVKKIDSAGRPIVVYCSGGDCELSMDLAKVLIEAGKRRVLIYEGGFPEWQGAGYAVAKGPNP